MCGPFWLRKVYPYHQKMKRNPVRNSLALFCVVSFLALTLSSCITNQSGLESHRTVGKGKVQAGGHYASMPFSQSLPVRAAGANLGFGITDRVDVKANYEHRQAFSRPIMDLFAVGAKVRINNWLTSMTQVAFGNGRSYEVMTDRDFVTQYNYASVGNVSHTLLAGTNFSDKFEVVGHVRAGYSVWGYMGREDTSDHIGDLPMDNPFDFSTGFNLGISTNLDRWALRPGVSLVTAENYSFEEEATAFGFSYGVGLNVNFGLKRK